MENKRYIYGFSDYRKDNVIDTLMSCFYIGKQSQKKTTFERGYDHIDPKKDANSERFKNAKCFVIAQVPLVYDINAIERYFIEMIRPELNILCNPDVNGIEEEKLLYRKCSNIEIMSELKFYVFDMEYLLNTISYDFCRSRFDVEQWIKKVEVRDSKTDDQVVYVPFDELMNMGCDEIVQKYSGKKISTVGERSKGMMFHDIDDPDSYYSVKNIREGKIELSRRFENYPLQNYESVYVNGEVKYSYIERTQKLKEGMNNTFVELYDREGNFLGDNNSKESIVLMNQNYNFEHGYFDFDAPVLFDPKVTRGKYKYTNYSIGNAKSVDLVSRYFSACCKLLDDKYPEVSKSIKLSNLCREYRTLLDYCSPSYPDEALYLLGIAHNLYVLPMNEFPGVSLTNFPMYCCHGENTIEYFVKEYDAASEEDVAQVTYDDLVSYQNCIDAYYDANLGGKEEPCIKQFRSNRDVIFAKGYFEFIKGMELDYKTTAPWTPSNTSFRHKGYLAMFENDNLD